MSATAWIGASQVTRSACGSRRGSVSSVSAGSSIQASGKASSTRRYRAGSGGLSTTVPEYCPLRSIESTQPSSRSSSKIAVRPVRAGVELEAQRGVDREERAESRRGRRVAEAPGGDERDGSGRASDDVAERASRLTEREIERCALERPAAVVLVVVAIRAPRGTARPSRGGARSCPASTPRREAGPHRVPAGPPGGRRRT